MADRSGIEWTDATWNPVTGCTKVSPGCDHCYAETLHERFHGKGSFAEVKLHPERLDMPLRWRKPRRVFVNSMSDLFHEAISDEYIAKVFAVMALAHRHTFQLLTKRHGRMRSLLSRPDFAHEVGEEATGILERTPSMDSRISVHGWDPQGDLENRCWVPPWPLPNVWLGVSVEDQKWADVRIPALLDTPAAVRFLSCEPLLGPIDIEAWLHDADCIWHERSTCTCQTPRIGGVDWVIVGGESGRGARAMHPAWVRSLRAQTWHAPDAYFLFKQWGCHAPWIDGTPSGGYPYVRMEDDTRMAVMPKRRAGRELDGRTWDEYPADRTAVPS